MPLSKTPISLFTPGDLDKNFGVNGVSIINVPGASSSEVTAVINGPDDTLFLCGSADVGSRRKFFVTALNQDGEIITKFGDAGYVIDNFGLNEEDAYARDLILVDGKNLLLVGSSRIGDDPFPALAKFDLQGNFDRTFGENNQGKVIIPIVGPPGITVCQNSTFAPKSRAVSGDATQEGTCQIQTDGRIILTHYFFRLYNSSYGVIIRLLPNGILDMKFNSLGYVDVVAPGYEGGQTQIQSVTVDAGGRYIACGSLYDFSSPSLRTFFVRYGTLGKIDTTFGQNGFQIFAPENPLQGGERAERVTTLADGSIFSLGGSVHDPFVGQMLKLKNTGDIDPHFNLGQPLNTQLDGSSTLWKAFKFQSDGKIVVAGALDKQPNSYIFDVLVVRFDKQGELDLTFNTGVGWVRTSLGEQTAAAFTALLQNSKILVAGFSGSKGAVLRYHG